MPRPHRNRVRVLLPLPLAGTYDYAIPPLLAARPGSFVVAPLGGRRVAGVVWDGEGDAERVGDNRLREIVEVLDVPPMTQALRRFVDWVADYTLSPPGAVLRMAMSSPGALESPSPQIGWRLAQPLPDGPRITPERKRVLDAMAGHAAMAGAALASAAGVSPGVLRGMADHGLLAPALLARAPDFAEPDHRPATLGEEQALAADALRDRVRARGFSTTLLTGVTGSGKTEVYLDAIGEALRQGRQSLVLLPEIALSAQWLGRFRARFGGAEPALWHSEVPSNARRRTWRAIAEGRAPVVVGARSALFLPFPDLGLLVVDEEHETAFKQEDGVIYHARDLGVLRAKLAGAAAVLVSATPSLETVFNAEAGRYHAHHLPSRHGGAALPVIAALDLRVDPPERGRFLAPPLTAAIHATLARGEQAMLFLNRRGYAPLTLCRACGHRVQCPNCTAWLVEHRAQRRLQCHHCGHAEPLPPACPECGNEGTLVPVGPGVERITEEAEALFPEARLLLMASDTIPGPAAAAEAARRIEEREVDVIIGTQVVAKGWHFPHLTLVGVVDADLGLAGGDLRAAERTMQLLHQVAGRAGREQNPGTVLVQTFSPDHPVMRALVANDFDGFLRAEKEQRAPGHWPPFGRLAALIVSSEDAHAADRAARDLGLAAPSGEGIQVLGPAPAPLALLRGRHRRRLLLKAERGVRVQPILRGWLERVEIPSDVRVQVDVDPVAFL